MKQFQKNRKQTKVLFFFPPVWDVSSPYLSIPQLAAYLEDKGVLVRACDLNLEIMRWMLSSEGTNKLLETLETVLRSRKLPKKDFLELSTWVRFWHRDLPKDHLAVSQILRRPQSFSAREYYRAHDLIKRCWNLMHMLENASQFDAKIIPPHVKEIRSLMDHALQWNPDIVAFSAVVHEQLINTVDYADYIHGIREDVRVVIGGPASTIAFGTVFDKSYVPDALDCCVVGRGEGALLSLIRMFEDGKIWPRILHGGNCPSKAPLRIPKYDCLPVSHYLSSHSHLCYPFSEGCYWHKCFYCDKTIIPKYMARPGRIVATQLEHLKEKFGCYEFSNTGSALASNHAENIAESIRKLKIDVQWSTLVRPEKVWTKAHFEKLRESGLKTLQFGVESLSDNVLKAMNRGLSVDNQIKAIKAACESGLKPTLFLIFDLPTETPYDFILTLDRITPYISHLSSVVLSDFQLFPDSDIAAHPDKFGITTAVSPATLFEHDVFRIDMLKNRRDETRTNQKWKAWDRWVNMLHHDRSLLFFRADRMAMVLFDDDLLFGDKVRDKPVNSGYFLLAKILNRKYRLNADRIQRGKSGKGTIEYILRDQIKVLGRRRKSLEMLQCLKKGLSVGDSLKHCCISARRDVGAFNEMVQVVNTLDLSQVLIP